MEKDNLDIKLENLFQKESNFKKAVAVGKYLLKKETPDSSKNLKRLKQIKKKHGYNG